MNPRTIVALVNGISGTAVQPVWREHFNRYLPDDIRYIIRPLSLLTPLRLFMERPMAIHGHHIKAVAYCLPVVAAMKTRLFFTVHGSVLFYNHINRILFFFIALYSERIVFVSQHLKDEALETPLAFFSRKFEVIYNGLDFPLQFSCKAPTHHHIDFTNDLTLFHPARLSPVKNHLNLLKAVHIYNEKHRGSRRVILFLAGDGRLRQSLELAARRLKIAKEVVFLGTIPRQLVFAYMKTSSLVVMPSESEGLNISILEALSLGKKCVVGDIPSFRYLASDLNCETGGTPLYLADPHSPDDIAAAIETCLGSEDTYFCLPDCYKISFMIKQYIGLFLA